MKSNKCALVALSVIAMSVSGAKFGTAQENLSKSEMERIAEEAFIYAFPMMGAYKTMYEFNIDRTSSQYKGPFNVITNEARLATPKDTAVVTPNSDTPYSIVQLDLRAEPMVLCVPEVEKGRYYSVQLVDMYTCNYGYIGSRATGNGTGCYLVAGPSWGGDKPKGIDKVFRCESDFSLAIYRTQLFNPADMDNVKKIQAGYKVATLSEFLKRTPLSPAPMPAFPKFEEKAAFGTDFIRYLNFLLEFCPEVPAEGALRERFARIGIEANKPFVFAKLPPAQQAAITAGVKSGMQAIERRRASIGKEVNGWRIGAAFGNRAFYKGDWTLRAAAALAGIYGNDASEALYPLAATDNQGDKLDGTKHRYTLTFAAGQLPPVNAFWSVTMYDGKTQLLFANPIHRYLINSPMLPSLQKSTDGSITLYIQNQSPGSDKESNWLPAPAGPIYMVMRLYWPKEESLKGKWAPPVIQRNAD
jgi:hypothetical protein